MCGSIPLPKWAVEEMEKDPDLAYTDQWGRRNFEYLSLGCDTLPVLKGRSPVQCYSDFMRAFRDNFKHFLGDTIVVNIYSNSFYHYMLFLLFITCKFRNRKQSKARWYFCNVEEDEISEINLANSELVHVWNDDEYDIVIFDKSYIF